ncbi:MAG: DEAD/DEAH box helicase [Rubripirellula sp.]
MIRTSHHRPKLKEADRRVFDQVACSAKQHLGIEMRDVQLLAGSYLLERRVAEMQTGEGKTLTTVLAAAALAKSGRRVLVATANDYLVDRDCEWMRQVYRDLGLSVAGVTSASTFEQRTEAYRCDVTYGTLREFAFDFLRHVLAKRNSDNDLLPVCSFDALIVDEADSLLIDEARTPLIITAPTGDLSDATQACYRWAANLAISYLPEHHYIQVPGNGAIALTESGRRKFSADKLPVELAELTTTQIIHSLERAIWVNENVRRDHGYVVIDQRVHLVDEYTGRPSADRNFGAGIQQAVEARERLPLTPESVPVARIPIQEFVGRFRHLSGITATAEEDRRELRAVYDLSVKRVSTHQACRRVLLNPIVCDSETAKRQRIVQETLQMTEQGRCVLIGTRSVSQSEDLSECFHQQNVGHVVLNARNDQDEAEIIARAGQARQITIATNMAGRGTDIRLTVDTHQAGGLHVIVSESHASSRIDRQLIGRSARQGDPGSARVFISPDDHVFLQANGSAWAAITEPATARSGRWWVKQLARAQKIVTAAHREERARLTAQAGAMTKSLTRLGLDPYLDPLPDVVD